jgi:hypothetical protein
VSFKPKLRTRELAYAIERRKTVQRDAACRVAAASRKYRLSVAIRGNGAMTTIVPM